MKTQRTRFLIDVTDHDVIDVWFDVTHGRIEAFAANYRALIQEQWRAVVRYDTAHGALHVHRFWRPEHRQITPLEPRPATDYTQALAKALDDLDANWRSYRRALEDTI